MTNYIRDQIVRQLATQSSAINITSNQGGYQYVDSNNGKPISGPSVDSLYLSNPPKETDPRLSSKVITAARGNIVGNNIPEALADSLAVVAAYVSTVNSISVQQLFVNNIPTLELLAGYNTFKPKGSQLGVFGDITKSAWESNPTLRGSVALVQ